MKESSQEKAALDMTYLRVILVLVNEIYEEEVLLDKKSIVLMSRRNTTTTSEII